MPDTSIPDNWPVWMARERRSSVAATVALSFFAPLPEVEREPASDGRAGLWVEVLDPAAAAAHTDAWRTLAERASDANAFAGPDCALAAAQHLARGEPLRVLFVWHAGPRRSREDLRAACLLRRPARLPFAFARVVRHEQAALGALLVGPVESRAALQALLDHIGRAWPGAAGLVVPRLALDGTTAALLRDIGGQGAHILDAGARAVLERGAGLAMTGQRRQKLNRRRKSLVARGALTLTVAATRETVLAATEEFLRLEAKGWKGRTGTALVSTLPAATFARTLTRGFTHGERCRILALRLDGAPIAMAIVLRTGDRAFVWKVAYDEVHAACSPGAQLILDLTRLQEADPGVALTDSCAIPDHPMIDRMWAGRMDVGDIVLPLPGGSARRFALALAMETRRRALRERVKRLVRRLNGAGAKSA